MFSKKENILLLAILGLVIINLLILRFKDNGFRYNPYTTYENLYVSDSSFYIKAIHIDSNTASLELSLPLRQNNYVVYIDSPNAQYPIHQQRDQLVFNLQNGHHTYYIQPNDSTGFPRFYLKMEHTPEGNAVNECSIPIMDRDPVPLSYWEKCFGIFSEREKEIARKILTQNTKFFQKKNETEQVSEIVKYVMRLPSNPQGILPDDQRALSPLEQLQLAQQHKSALDCGVYTTIFFYLFSSVNIPVRSTGYWTPIHTGNWKFPAHSLCEIYLRYEQQWAIIDGQNNIFLAKDGSHLINTVDIRKMAEIGSFSNKTTYTYVSGDLLQVPFDSVSNNIFYYNKVNTDIMIAPFITRSNLKKIKEFYLFHHDYYMYADSNENDWTKIFLKLISATLLPVFVAYYFYLRMKQRKIRK